MFLCPGPGAAKCRILCGQELIPGRAVLHVPPDRAEDLCCDPDECIHITVKELRKDGTVRVGFADGREAWVASEAVSMNQAGTMRGRGGGVQKCSFHFGTPRPPKAWGMLCPQLLPLSSTGWLVQSLTGVRFRKESRLCCIRRDPAGETRPCARRTKQSSRSQLDL